MTFFVMFFKYKFNINLVRKYMKSSKTRKKKVGATFNKPTPLSKLVPSKTTDPYCVMKTSNNKKTNRSRIKSNHQTNRSRMHTSNYEFP